MSTNWQRRATTEEMSGGIRGRCSLGRSHHILDIDDPRHGLRRGRRGRYHSRRHGSSLDALSRRDGGVPHDLLGRWRHQA
jgi:hypothetical protein